MIIRKIKDSELKRTDELFSIAFEFKCGSKETAAEMAERVRTNPQSRGELYAGEKWAAFEDDDRTMMAFLASTPYPIQFDGRECRMGGIGGVSTLAQYRRRGAIRGCFNQMLRDLYDEGFEFSALYPFSTAYYRKFGYELGALYNVYSVDMRAIPAYDAGGSVELIEQGRRRAEIQQVYDGFRQGCNLMALHEEIDDRWIEKADPACDQNYTYLYLSASGEPKGLMSFVKERCGDPAEFHFKLRFTRFWFTDSEGLKGLLNHCLAFRAYYETVQLDLPEDVDLTNVIPEWALYPWERKQCYKGMVRVVNVEKALRMAKYRGGGELALNISDAVLSENNHTFRLRFQEGTAVSVEIDDAAQPDAELPIGDFSRFLLGTHAAEAIRFVENVRLTAPIEKIGQIFYKKPIFLTEAF